jgi:hypothetical protein
VASGTVHARAATQGHCLVSFKPGLGLAPSIRRGVVLERQPQVRRGFFYSTFSCNLPPPLMEFEFPTCFGPCFLNCILDFAIPVEVAGVDASDSGNEPTARAPRNHRSVGRPVGFWDSVGPRFVWLFCEADGATRGSLRPLLKDFAAVAACYSADCSRILSVANSRVRGFGTNPKVYTTNKHKSRNSTNCFILSAYILYN